jgi:hypothetical protein
MTMIDNRLGAIACPQIVSSALLSGGVEPLFPGFNELRDLLG